MTAHRPLTPAQLQVITVAHRLEAAGLDVTFAAVGQGMTPGRRPDAASRVIYAMEDRGLLEAIPGAWGFRLTPAGRDAAAGHEPLRIGEGG